MTRWIQPAVVAVALLAACGGQSADPPPRGLDIVTCPITTPVASPTFTTNILPVLQASCGKDSMSCHGTATPAGHVAYDGTAATVFGALVNVTPSAAPPGMMRVKPNDLANSWLYVKITQDAPGGSTSTYGNRMPYAAGNLCAATVTTIANWINNGAPL